MNPAWRATAFGAALYLLVGANLPYLPVWLEQGRGFSGAQISGTLAVATVLRIFTGPMLAAEAERRGLRRVLGQLSLVLLLAYLTLVPTAPFVAVAGLATLVFVAWGALAPLTEALLLSGTKAHKPDYGMARAIASAAFIVSSLLVGGLVRRFGTDAILWWLVVAAGLLTLASLLQTGQGVQSPVRARFRTTLADGFRLYAKRRILLAGLSTSLIQASHAYYYNLGSNVWIGQGISEGHIGALWSTGVAVEVGLLLGSGWLFAKWTPGALIILGGLGAILRWTLTGFAPPLEQLYALQGLHALTFATTHIGIMRFLAEEVTPEKIPAAMSINSAIGYGPLLAVSGLLVGLYYDNAATNGAFVQARGYWLMAGMGGLGCLCAWPLRKRQPQSAELGE